MLSFFPRDVLDDILNLVESVSKGFPSYSSQQNFSDKDIDVINFVRRFQNFIGGILTLYLNIMSD